MMYFKDSVVAGVVLLIVFACWTNAPTAQAFGLDIHHRYSHTVKDFLPLDGLPEKGSLDYYAAMAHRDHLSNSRRLATTPAASPYLTFLGGNDTYRLSSLGFLHYVIVTVGTPPLTFLVALDTGSDLFWLPCDCTSCTRSLNSSSASGRPLSLNIYSPSNSSTSLPIPCNSTKCGERRGCVRSRNACGYQEKYLSSNTSSTGILVDDVLYLGTDANPQKPVNASITLGCGIVQTGDFLDGAAINGLLGLGMDEVSVPSILASKGLAANSFSMCFGSDGIGRIEFGDKGSSSQRVTPINLEGRHPTYNVTVTQIALEKNVTDLEFSVIFDSGTSFTYLNDPSYSVITEGFNSQVTEPRYQPETRIIFDYCYALGATQENFTVPNLNFTMKGGHQFLVNAPTVVIPRRDGGAAYCLAIVKSEDIDIIGQNFMAGYRLVFDREEMVLGWEDADCYDANSGSNNLPVNKGNPAAAPSPSMLNPEATPGNRTRPPTSSRLPPPLSTQPSNAQPGATTSNSITLMLILSILLHFTILSS